MNPQQGAEAPFLMSVKCLGFSRKRVMGGQMFQSFIYPQIFSARILFSLGARVCVAAFLNTIANTTLCAGLGQDVAKEESLSAKKSLLGWLAWLDKQKAETSAMLSNTAPFPTSCCSHILFVCVFRPPALSWRVFCTSRQESVHLPDSSIKFILLDCLDALEVPAVGHKHLWLT